MKRTLLPLVVLGLSAGTVLTGCTAKSGSSAPAASSSQPPGTTVQAQIAQIQRDRNIPPQAKTMMIQKLKQGQGSTPTH